MYTGTGGIFAIVYRVSVKTVILRRRTMANRVTSAETFYLQYRTEVRAEKNVIGNSNAAC